MAFAVGIALNLGFVVVEAVYGVLAHSVALVADAAHNLSDVLGLALAWGAFVLARRKPSKRRTYGLRKSTVLAALANAVLLFIAVGAIAWEAIGRLREPEPTSGVTVMAVAAAGVAVNGLSALLFARGSKSDYNMRGAFLHLAMDAAVSLGVVVSGALIVTTGFLWVDPAVSLVVSVVVVFGSWGLLKGSLDLALDAVPAHIDLEKVQEYLAALPGVTAVHDLHIWAMSTTETALTAHLVMPTGACDAAFLARVEKDLHHDFRIEHATLQVEAPEAPPCRLAGEGTL